MPQNAFFPHPRDLQFSQNSTQRHFFFVHPPSPFQGNFCNCKVVAFVLLRNSRFICHCCTQGEATPTQKSARKWRCDLSRLLARKITKGIHSCKPASLNRPIEASLPCQKRAWVHPPFFVQEPNWVRCLLCPYRACCANTGLLAAGRLSFTSSVRILVSSLLLSLRHPYHRCQNWTKAGTRF